MPVLGVPFSKNLEVFTNMEYLEIPSFRGFITKLNKMHVFEFQPICHSEDNNVKFSNSSQCVSVIKFKAKIKIKTVSIRIEVKFQKPL